MNVPGLSEWRRLRQQRRPSKPIPHCDHDWEQIADSPTTQLSKCRKCGAYFSVQRIEGVFS